MARSRQAWNAQFRMKAPASAPTPSLTRLPIDAPPHSGKQQAHAPPHVNLPRLPQIANADDFAPRASMTAVAMVPGVVVFGGALLDAPTNECWLLELGGQGGRWVGGWGPCAGIGLG